MSKPITAHIYVVWRLTRATREKFLELMQMAEDLNDEDPALQEIAEQIKSLPGFPINAPPESDFLLEITDTIH